MSENFSPHSYTAKACPFCGGTRIKEDFVPNTDGNLRFMRCEDCNAKGPWSKGATKAPEQWDKRILGPGMPQKEVLSLLMRWYSQGKISALNPDQTDAMPELLMSDTKDFIERHRATGER